MLELALKQKKKKTALKYWRINKSMRNVGDEKQVVPRPRIAKSQKRHTLTQIIQFHSFFFFLFYSTLFWSLCSYATKYLYENKNKDKKRKKNKTNKILSCFLFKYKEKQKKKKLLLLRQNND